MYLDPVICCTDNVIRGNQWGGVDIRHGGDPVVSGNTISHGIGDGIVIGERGRGSLENNLISGKFTECNSQLKQIFSMNMYLFVSTSMIQVHMILQYISQLLMLSVSGLPGPDLIIHGLSQQNCNIFTAKA